MNRPVIAREGSLGDNYLIRNFIDGLRLVFQDNLTKYSFVFLLLLLGLAVVGPYVTPYQYDKTLYSDDGQILRNEPPSLAHPLGTTSLGYDVLSRIVYGARPTVVTGLLGGSLIISIGMLVGISAGFVGGRTDDVLMRFTDFVYGVPLIPFAIVMLTLLGVGFFTSIFVIGLVLWRSNARVLRSQVLQIKERPFILAAKATGASNSRIIVKHILPNVAPMAILFFALGIGYSIIIQASLSFLGVSSPFVPSWGIMLRNAYKAGLLARAWWWSLPPGILISTTVMAAFMFGRGYEKLTGEQRDEIVVEG